MEFNLFDRGSAIEYVDIKKELIPCSFSVNLIDRTYRMTVLYNERGDFFTADLAIPGVNDEPLCYGEVMRYGKPLFEAFSDERYPLPVIVPMCVFGGDTDEITYDNFGDTVKLYLFPRPLI